MKTTTKNATDEALKDKLHWKMGQCKGNLASKKNLPSPPKIGSNFMITTIHECFPWLNNSCEFDCVIRLSFFQQSNVPKLHPLQFGVIESKHHNLSRHPEVRMYITINKRKEKQAG